MGGPPRCGGRGRLVGTSARRLPAGQSARDKGAANTCRSWRGRRFSPPKRPQLPTVTGIKLRGPDGSFGGPVAGGGGGEEGGGRGAGEGREGPQGANGD